MKSTLLVPPGTAGQQDTVPAAAAGTCRYPGCGNPARARDGDGPGAPPRYCGRTVAEDRGQHGTAEVTHTALTAFRRRQELAGADPGEPAGRPVTAAIARAAAIRDDVLAAITALPAQLEGVLGQLGQVGAQLAAAASPEAAEAQVEAIRAETAAGLETARAELAGQAARAHAAQAARPKPAPPPRRPSPRWKPPQTARAQRRGPRSPGRRRRPRPGAAAGQARPAPTPPGSSPGPGQHRGGRWPPRTPNATPRWPRRQPRTRTPRPPASSSPSSAPTTTGTPPRSAAAHQAQLAALDETITELRARLHRAEADAAADRAERQHLTDRLHELTTRPAADPQGRHRPDHPPGRPPAAGPALPSHPKEHTMSELVTTRIGTHAARLGLPHLAAAAPALIQRAHDAQLGYADFLDLILGEEAAAKDDRRFASALHVSGLPHHKTLDDFDFTFQPDLDIRKIKDLATLGFIAQAANIALLGPPGTGKTHLACALAVAACAAGKSVYFTTLDDMIRKLRAADAAGDLGRQLRGYLRSSILIIDEVGYLPLNRHDANLVFQIIARRYEKGSVIITSNKTFSKAHMFARTCAR